jgi:hypothetical protein
MGFAGGKKRHDVKQDVEKHIAVCQKVKLKVAKKWVSGSQTA